MLFGFGNRSIKQQYINKQDKKELLKEVALYIDENYGESERIRIPPKRLHSLVRVPRNGLSMFSLKLNDLIRNLDEPFNVALLQLIDAKGKTDVEVYKRANIDRKLFSKIRKGKGYLPSKRTALALAVALELTLEETDDLLERAGYALSHSQKFDVIVEYFIISGNYNIFEINEILYHYDQPLLGAN